jgi:hypothetical protein
MCFALCVAITNLRSISSQSYPTSNMVSLMFSKMVHGSWHAMRCRIHSLKYWCGHISWSLSPALDMQNQKYIGTFFPDTWFFSGSQIYERMRNVLSWHLPPFRIGRTVHISCPLAPELRSQRYHAWFLFSNHEDFCA